DRFLNSELSSAAGLPCSILLIDAAQHFEGRTTQRANPEYVVGKLCEAIRAGLRGADLLFTFDADRFVALLTQTGTSAADGVANKIALEFGTSLISEGETAGVLSIRIGRATAPEDGRRLPDLIRAADGRSRPAQQYGSRPSIH